MRNKASCKNGCIYCVLVQSTINPLPDKQLSVDTIRKQISYRTLILYILFIIQKRSAGEQLAYRKVYSQIVIS